MLSDLRLTASVFAAAGSEIRDSHLYAAKVAFETAAKGHFGARRART